MAAKNELVNAGKAGLEQLVRSMIPELVERMDALAKQMEHLQERFGAVEKRIDSKAAELQQSFDARLHELEIKMYDRFESTRDVINEVAQRITKLDARLDAYVEIARNQASLNQNLIERLVRLETVGSSPVRPSRRRAG